MTEENPERRGSGESEILEVGRDDAGVRLDRFLAARLELSRAQVRRLLAGERVRLRGAWLREGEKGLLLSPGTQIEVARFTRPEDLRIVAEPERPLTILAQGADWLAADKPAGMAVHPLREGELDSLAGAVIARFPEMHGVGEGALRSGVVHRLDLPTSGVVLFATAEPQWGRLREAFRGHRIEKTYRALVWGRLSGEGTEERLLEVANHRPARVRVVEDPSKAGNTGVRETRLHWRALEQFQKASLLEVRLETGFLHQIRVVLSYLGYPLVGDPVYGAPDREASMACSRLMLHASKISLEEIVAESPDPEDFTLELERFRAEESS